MNNKQDYGKLRRLVNAVGIAAAALAVSAGIGIGAQVPTAMADPGVASLASVSPHVLTSDSNRQPNQPAPGQPHPAPYQLVPGILGAFPGW